MDDVFDDGFDEELLAAAEHIVDSDLKPSTTESQKRRAEKNRLKAVALKKSRLARPLPEKEQKSVTGEKLGRQKEAKKLVDTNAGFFIEEDGGGSSKGSQDLAPAVPAPVIEPDRPKCLECRENLAESYLLRMFDYEVCDSCRETEREGKHELITKTEAKNEFLLKDIDFERKPALKFSIRKNPHNPRWGDMKLYLRFQVEKRALEVWGSEDALEEEHEKRERNREEAKVKKFNKKLKALRMQVRGSLYKKVDLSTHEHEYGEEIYDEAEDQYSRKCKTCNHVHSYEKM